MLLLGTLCLSLVFVPALLQQSSYAWKAGYFTVVPFEMAGRAYLYERSSADPTISQDIVRIDSDHQAPTQVWKSGGQSDNYSIVTFAQTGQQYIFGYDRSNGNAIISKFTAGGANGYVPVWYGNLPVSFVRFVPLYLNGQPYLLEYNYDSGAAVIFRINEGGKGVSAVWGDNVWGAKWFIIAPFAQDGQQYIVKYDIDNGLTALDKVNAEGNGTTNVWEHMWMPGIYQLIPFTMDDQEYLFRYHGGGDPSAGIVQVSLDDSGNRSTSVLSPTWGASYFPNYGSIVPFTLDGQQYLWQYQVFDGTTTIVKLNHGGKGVTETWRDNGNSGSPSNNPPNNSSNNDNNDKTDDNVSQRGASTAKVIDITIVPGAYAQKPIPFDAYSPRVATVSVGDTVVWNNKDDSIHTVLSGTFKADGKFGFDPDGGEISIHPGQRFLYTPTEAGNYTYHCEFHPWMQGELQVFSNDTADGTSSNNAQLEKGGRNDTATTVETLMSGNTTAKTTGIRNGNTTLTGPFILDVGTAAQTKDGREVTFDMTITGYVNVTNNDLFQFTPEHGGARLHLTNGTVLTMKLYDMGVAIRDDSTIIFEGFSTDSKAQHVYLTGVGVNDFKAPFTTNSTVYEMQNNGNDMEIIYGGSPDTAYSVDNATRVELRMYPN